MGAIEGDAHHNTTLPKGNGGHMHQEVPGEMLGCKHSLGLLCRPKNFHHSSGHQWSDKGHVQCFHSWKDMQHHKGRANLKLYSTW